MTPSKFKERFVKARPEVPPGIEIDISEFVEFDSDVLDGVGLSESDKEFLTSVGLPKSAVPFLSFYAWDIVEQTRMGVIPEGTSFFALGHNGYGDTIVIDLHNGEVVYFNHDRNMEKVFVNSSVVKLAESLCIFAEHLHGGKMENCLAAIERVDEAVKHKKGFWAEEVSNEIASGS